MLEAAARTDRPGRLADRAKPAARSQIVFATASFYVESDQTHTAKRPLKSAAIFFGREYVCFRNEIGGDDCMPDSAVAADTNG
ncbi:hypothetical protein PQR62_15735 [Herbaspirillum lusitanum]|jgi:hypothetical protein|uniref:Uncharacterized protein n=1 Tax=Herbaspirillum lusitanum TaxID=213312 RepID=A0ABW9ABN5_9BURK